MGNLTIIDTGEGCPYGNFLEASIRQTAQESLATHDRINDPNLNSKGRKGLRALYEAQTTRIQDIEAMLKGCETCEGEPSNTDVIDRVCPVAALALEASVRDM